MNFDALFIKWKSKYDFNAFIRDGIVDSEHYDSPHILFVLRDMNCQSELDLCADLRKDGSGWKTWNNISRWTKALWTALKRIHDLCRKKNGCGRSAVWQL